MFVRDAEGISRLAMGKYQVLHLILQWLVLIKINGTLITPIRPTVYHYHCRAEYIKAAEPSFIQINNNNAFNNNNRLLIMGLDGEIGLR